MNSSDIASGFIEKYKTERFRYEQLKELLCAELRQIADSAGISLTHVQGRTKEPDSVFEKIKRKNYTDPPSQLIDLCGVRVITTYESDISKMARAIRKDLRPVATFLNEHCGMKHPANRAEFGYEAMHLVIRVDHGEIPWKRYQDVQVEIQIRSTLRHGWAVVSHDMLYKQIVMPEEKILREMRLAAGSVSQADQAFDHIKMLISKRLDGYNIRIKKGNFKSISMNELALATYFRLRHNQIEPQVKKLKDIGVDCGMQTLNLPEFDQISVARLAFTLEKRGIKNLGDADSLLGKIMRDLQNARSSMKMFMKCIIKHGAVFNADGVDILTVLVSLHNDRSIRMKLFPTDFDWSGEHLSKPTAKVLSATREACKATMERPRPTRKANRA